jgi:hypothetical protein
VEKGKRTMRNNELAASIGHTMFWIWLVVVVVALLAYFLRQRWRRAHPVHKPKPPPKRSYSQTLQQRLASNRQGHKHKRRREPPPSDGPPSP